MMTSKSRWALVPVAVITAFIGAIALSIPMNRGIHALYWSVGHCMPGKEFVMIVMQYDGALAAFMVVAIGSMTAPHSRRVTGLVILLIGAAVTWALVGDMTPTTFYSQQHYPEGPPRVWSPLMGTYVGGLLGLLAISIKESRQNGPTMRSWVRRFAPPHAAEVRKEEDTIKQHLTKGTTMKRPVHVFVIESEKPKSPTSVHSIYDEVCKTLHNAGSLGKSEFHDALSLTDLISAATTFGTWTKALPSDEPVVLWISVHGEDPEPGVPDDKRKYVGTAGISARGEKIEWFEFLVPIKSAQNPQRVIVLMDVCWGSSPTAPARLTTPAVKRPAVLFGPARHANRTELDEASRSLFDFLAKSGVPIVNEGKKLVDSLNSQFHAAQPSGTLFYRMWWWENNRLQRHPYRR